METDKYEAFLDRIGRFGRYQRQTLFLLFLVFCPCGYYSYFPVFVYFTPGHRCFIPEIDQNTNLSATEKEILLPYFIPPSADLMELDQCLRYRGVNGSQMDLNLRKNVSNVNVNLTINKQEEKCVNGWFYNVSAKQNTLIMELNLVCESSLTRPWLTSVFILGQLLGSVATGYLADKFGRKPVILLMLYGTGGIFLIASFISSIVVYLICMFLAGCFSMSFFLCTLVLGMELADRKHRATVGIASQFFFTAGYMLLPLGWYVIQEWRWFMRLMSLFAFAFFPYIWIIPESPRWLLSKGRRKEATEIMRKMAARNGIKLHVVAGADEKSLATPDEDEENAEKKIADSESNATICFLINEVSNNNNNNAEKENKEIQNRPNVLRGIFLNSVMLKRTLNIFLQWCSCLLCLMTLSLNTSNLGSNSYFNCFISACTEIPSFLIATYTTRRLGRIPAYFGVLLTTGIFCGITPLILPYSEISAIVSAMAGKLFASGATAMVYSLTGDMFPTYLRNTGIGIVSAVCRMASAVSPFLIYAGETGYRSTPYYVISGITITSAFLSLQLPETQNITLPETIEDAVRLERHKVLKNIKFCAKQSNSDESELDLEKITSA